MAARRRAFDARLASLGYADEEGGEKGGGTDIELLQKYEEQHFWQICYFDLCRSPECLFQLYLGLV